MGVGHMKALELVFYDPDFFHFDVIGPLTDARAGEWPQAVVEGLAGIAAQCFSHFVTGDMRYTYTGLVRCI